MKPILFIALLTTPLLACQQSSLTTTDLSDMSAADASSPGVDSQPDLNAPRDASNASDASDASDAALADTGARDAGVLDSDDMDMSTRTCASAQSPEPGLAFPTAEGFGRLARGGRGGQVIEITTLEDSGPGSMRACLTTPGPRTCVFRTSGTITLASNLSITEPFVTLAGQTAPGQGIIVRGNQIEAKTHDVIIRYMRTATGPESGASSTGGIEAFMAQRVIVDHCSMTWAPDDTVSIWGETTQDITYQWNLVAEGLSGADFGKGMLIGGGATRASVLHNFIAHHSDRLPQIQTTYVQMVNNLVYNAPGNINVNPAPVAVDASFVGNYFQQGPDSAYPISTTIRTLAHGWPGQVDYPQSHDDDTRLYLLDNYHSKLRPDSTLPEEDLVYQGGAPLPIVSTPFIDFPALYSVIPSGEVPDTLALMGATLPVRTSIDTRILATFTAGTGNALIKSPAEVGGWPIIPVETRAADYDTDVDGMPDVWEREQGFDPADPSDGVDDADGDSYTNIEEFLNATDPWCPS